MTKELLSLLKAAKKVQISPEDAEEQRRSFAFGNANIENARVTRATIDREADRLRREKKA